MAKSKTGSDKEMRKMDGNLKRGNFSDEDLERMSDKYAAVSKSDKKIKSLKGRV